MWRAAVDDALQRARRQAGARRIEHDHVRGRPKSIRAGLFNWQSDLYWGTNQATAPHSHPINGMNVGWDFSEGNDCAVAGASEDDEDDDKDKDKQKDDDKQKDKDRVAGASDDDDDKNQE